MDDDKRVIGLTGGTGCGKSTVAAQFARRGIEVIDADLVSRDVCRPGLPCLADMTAAFGQDILNEDGTLNRKQLGIQVFGDEKKQETLNRISHHYIIEELERRIAASDNKHLLVDAALLLESSFSERCDMIVAVVAEDELRAKRIAARDDLTMDQALARIGAQHENGFYSSRADFVIYNNGDMDELSTQVDMVCSLALAEE